jgi:type IV pilus assembly protein PilC
MFYPIAILVVAFVITAVIMIFVIPAFKEVFKSFGADLPAPTLVVMAISDFFVAYWWAIFGIIGGGFYAFFESWKRSEKVQIAMDRTPPSPSRFRRHHSQIGHCPLDPHAFNNVRGRRTAG